MQNDARGYVAMDKRGTLYISGDFYAARRLVEVVTSEINPDVVQMAKKMTSIQRRAILEEEVHRGLVMYRCLQCDAYCLENRFATRLDNAMRASSNVSMELYTRICRQLIAEAKWIVTVAMVEGFGIDLFETECLRGPEYPPLCHDSGMFRGITFHGDPNNVDTSPEITIRQSPTGSILSYDVTEIATCTCSTGAHE